MTNRDISNLFKLLASLMELHEENSFKIKSYSNAYLTVRKANDQLFNLDFGLLCKVPGIGKGIAEKIIELQKNGSMQILEDFKDKTPPGVVKMLGVRGLGPKKVQIIWKVLGIEDISDLHLACTENRLVDAKGFGIKTQSDILEKINFYQSNQGKMHYASVITPALNFLSLVKKAYPNDLHDITGSLRRKLPEVHGIEIITTAKISDLFSLCEKGEENEDLYFFENIQVNVYPSSQSEFYKNQFLLSSAPSFHANFTFDETYYESEEEIFNIHQMSYVIPEYRETSLAIEQARANKLPTFIELDDLYGCLHNHSTYSDGVNTLDEMAAEVMRRHMTYLGISDHSKSAFYANGLIEERVEMQWREIDQLNKRYGEFKIFKSIECDILNDGRLDYGDDFLEEFDFIIASIHSNLRMDKEKATQRLLKAIEHPLVDIIGHPTGRLLLGRSGYELDMKVIMDACIANDVVIELNANPQRLDIDWTYIPYFIEKGGMISINPDAHSINQIDYIKYGVEVARKAGVSKENVLNAMTMDVFEKWTKR